MKNLCVVCECGWIIKGVEVSRVNGVLTLKDASVVRRWANGRGIGGIAKAKNKAEYTLDQIGDVDIMQGKILFMIPCEW